MKSFHGKHWAKHVHERIRPRFEQFGDIFLARVLPPFERINEEATALEKRRNEELVSSLDCPDEDRWDGEAAMAELALNDAMDYAVTLSSMRFSTLGLFSAALYHMSEQHLIDLRQEILVDDGHEAVSPDATIEWFKDEVGLKVKTLRNWELINELRLVANTVKHAEGSSAEALRRVRPQLFAFPGLDDRYVSKLRLRTPLFGQELFVTREDFVRYHQGSVSFWTELGEALSELTWTGVNSASKRAATATYERARRLANLAVWAVDLQCRRLRSVEPGDATFVLRKWADFDFLVVSLTRLRRAAKLTARVPELYSSLVAAIAQFDRALPGLKGLRDVAEHIDDYALDQGRNRSIERQSLEVSTLDEEGPTLHWLGSRLNVGEALRASQHLFAAIKEGSRVIRTGGSSTTDSSAKP